ncbi:MAG TPA: hypothetical protein VKZ79_09735 [Alphaproteobacteria bacterium]|nr:hypothetical protein [Alphaproteobacteria bacterium]
MSRLNLCNRAASRVYTSFLNGLIATGLARGVGMRPSWGCWGAWLRLG